MSKPQFKTNTYHKKANKETTQTCDFPQHFQDCQKQTKLGATQKYFWDKQTYTIISVQTQIQSTHLSQTKQKRQNKIVMFFNIFKVVKSIPNLEPHTNPFWEYKYRPQYYEASNPNSNQMLNRNKQNKTKHDCRCSSTFSILRKP